MNINDYVGFIYLTKNLKTGKKYIGQKQYFWFRKNKKIESNWKTYLGSSIELQKDIVYYGKKSFKRKILVNCKTLEDLDKIEAELQRKYNVINNPIWYNKNIQGRSFRVRKGWHHTDKTRKKMSRSAKIRTKRTVKNGTHNFCGGEIQRKTMQRRAKLGILHQQLNPPKGEKNGNCGGCFLFFHPLHGKHYIWCTGLRKKFLNQKLDPFLLYGLAIGRYTPKCNSYKGWTIIGNNT